MGREPSAEQRSASGRGVLGRTMLSGLLASSLGVAAVGSVGCRWSSVPILRRYSIHNSCTTTCARTSLRTQARTRLSGAAAQPAPSSGPPAYLQPRVHAVLGYERRDLQLQQLLQPFVDRHRRGPYRLRRPCTNVCARRENACVCASHEHASPPRSACAARRGVRCSDSSCCLSRFRRRCSRPSRKTPAASRSSSSWYSCEQGRRL